MTTAVDPPSRVSRLAILGAGVMGEALARGLLNAGWAPAGIVLSDVRSDHAADVGKRLGVAVAAGNKEAVAGAEGALLAVKPQDARPLLDELRGNVSSVVSIVAGLRIETMEQALGDGTAVVRAMPNTPARVGKGVTALAAGRFAGDTTKDLAAEIFGAVGPVVWVAEQHLDAVTALSGSGPAYVFLVAEALIDAGVALGLTRDVAETLVNNTILGAGAMLVETGEHPASLRAQVTSPGGTTAAALSVLEAMALRSAFIEAVRAAHRRSGDLGS